MGIHETTQPELLGYTGKPMLATFPPFCERGA